MELAANFEKPFPSGPVIHAALRMPANAFSVTVLFGPSGSGKTTVLRCLAGLERPAQGFIRFGDETWFDAERGICLPPQHRDIGYVFQEYALFPHLTVARNLAYGLGGLPAGERNRRVAEMLDLLGLSGLGGRYPARLSGGERQRVALGRALVRRPRLLLLDEPLSALDAPTREQLRRELRRLLATLGVPALLVTHDRVEALALGDAVVVLDAGRVCQSGPVAEVFSRPADLAVARVVGVETVEAATVLEVRDGLAVVAVGRARLVALAGDVAAGAAYVSIRAEDVILERGAAAGSARNRLPARVLGLVREGPMVRVSLDCGFPLTALVTSQACVEMGLREGDELAALIKAPAVHLIPRWGTGADTMMQDRAIQSLEDRLQRRW
jgi:molybdate transport system ATP-binding protein